MAVDAGHGVGPIDSAHEQRRPTKAVIPVAGLGTRFLPATKAMPKEMLPVVDKPAIQYVVEEAVAAGLTDVLMVTGRNKTSDSRTTSTATSSSSSRCEAKGDADRLAPRASESTDLAHIHYVRQGDPGPRARGAGRRAEHVGDEPFAVLLGDDLIDERDPLLRPHARGAGAARRQRRRADGGAAGTRSTSTAARPSTPPTSRTWSPGHRPGREAAGRRGAEQPGRHRSLRAAPGGLRRAARDAARTRRRDPADRRAADAGRACRRTQGGGVHGVVFRGRRYDTGDRADYLKAVVRLASERTTSVRSSALARRVRARAGAAAPETRRPHEDRRPAPRRLPGRHRHALPRSSCACSTPTAAR